MVSFDAQIHRMKLTSDWTYVLMTSCRFSSRSTESGTERIPEDMRSAILVEEESNMRKITVLLNDRRIKIERLSCSNQTIVYVGRDIVKVKKNKPYQEYLRNGEIIFEISELPNKDMKIISDIYGIDVVTDGETVKLNLAGKYRNVVRGLCGNFDSEPTNSTDLITPLSCFLIPAEEFATRYVLLENSKKSVVENKRRADQADCKELGSERLEDYHRNFISDREAGRSSTESKDWGYHQDNRKREQDRSMNRSNNKHNWDSENRSNDYQERRNNLVYRTKVVKEGDEICFTTKPVQTCREGTVGTKGGEELYQLYCQPRNEESIAMKRRVEQGANPDFTRKPATKLHVFNVPSNCIPL